MSRPLPELAALVVLPLVLVGAACSAEEKTSAASSPRPSAVTTIASPTPSPTPTPTKTETPKDPCEAPSFTIVDEDWDHEDFPLVKQDRVATAWTDLDVKVKVRNRSEHRIRIYYAGIRLAIPDVDPASRFDLKVYNTRTAGLNPNDVDEYDFGSVLKPGDSHEFRVTTIIRDITEQWPLLSSTQPVVSPEVDWEFYSDNGKRECSLPVERTGTVGDRLGDGHARVVSVVRGTSGTRARVEWCAQFDEVFDAGKLVARRGDEEVAPVAARLKVPVGEGRCRRLVVGFPGVVGAGWQIEYPGSLDVPYVWLLG